MSKIHLLVLTTAFIIFSILGVVYSRYSHKTNVGKARGLPEVKVITLTPTGFSPGSLTVSPGTAVRWTNNSGNDQSSVNSDNYPDNKLYPELNLGQFKNGASLVHIFNNPGTYTYHNQFMPNERGEIIVK